MDEAQETAGGASRTLPEEPATPLVDRYGALLERLDARAVAEKLRGIEQRLWFGEPGSPPIFADELREVRERGARRREASGGPDLLILCVGHSPEPLLLAVAHHAEVEVILLIEQSLEEEPLRVLGELWNEYRAPLGVPAFDQVARRQVRDDATDLFLTVREIVEEREGSRIVLDITGAKKSMIAGAFLAAGFLDLESSYVDFDQYDDAILRRPVPGRRPGKAVPKDAPGRGSARLADRPRVAE